MIQWLTMKEAAEYLKMGRSTIYKLLREGNLPAHKVGRGAVGPRPKGESEHEEAYGVDGPGCVGVCFL